MDCGVEDDEVVAVPWVEGWEVEVEEEEAAVETLREVEEEPDVGAREEETGVEEVEAVDGVEVAGELLLVVALCLVEAEEEE